MKMVPAAKFKEQCLALLDSVDPDGIIITKHGKPVAKLVPIHTDSATDRELQRQDQDQRKYLEYRRQVGC